MAELTPEEALALLRTRGFEAGFQRTPLRKFRGALDSITSSMEQRGGSPQPRLYFLYNFSELEVIKSTEPYLSPIAQIEIPHSNRDRSLMGVFGGSVDKIINPGIDESIPQDKVKGQDYLIGKVLEMEMTPGHMMWDGNRGEETPRDCWELTAIVGEDVAQPTTSKAPGVSLTQTALKLLDGKTEQQWYQVVFPAVKGDNELQQKIINREFLSPLEEAGVITKDADGVYHLVKQD